MALTIVYTLQAEEALDHLIGHVESQFSSSTALKVLDDIIERIAHLSVLP